MRNLAPIRTNVGRAVLMTLAVIWNSPLHGQETDGTPESQQIQESQDPNVPAEKRGSSVSDSKENSQERGNSEAAAGGASELLVEQQPETRPTAGSSKPGGSKTKMAELEPLRIVTLRGTDAELLSPGDVVDVISVERADSPYGQQPGAKQYSMLTLAESVHVHSVSKDRDQSSIAVSLRVPKSLVEGIVIAESTGIIRFVLHQPKQDPGSTMMSPMMDMVDVFVLEDRHDGSMKRGQAMPGMSGPIPGAGPSKFGDAMAGPLPNADSRSKVRTKLNTPGAMGAGMMQDSQAGDVSEVRQLLLEVRQLRQVIQGLRTDVNSLKQSIQAPDSNSEILGGPQAAMNPMLSGQPTPAAKVLINPGWQPHATGMDAAEAFGGFGASGGTTGAFGGGIGALGDDMGAASLRLQQSFSIELQRHSNRPCLSPTPTAISKSLKSSRESSRQRAASCELMDSISMSSRFKRSRQNAFAS